MKALLAKLVENGVRISVMNGTDVKIQPGKKPVADNDIMLLKQYKQNIINYLQDTKIGRMSYQQERLWFIDKMGYGFQYLVPGIAEIQGPVSLSALQYAVDCVVRQHESLRTNFIAINNIPCQKIFHNRTIPVQYIDISNAEKENRSQLKSESIRKFFDQPFKLEKDILFRALLIQLENEKFVWALSMHHIITDGWSMQLMMKELAVAYESYLKDIRITTDPLPLQYIDYAAWQREEEQDEGLQPSINFWKKELSGYRDLYLPTDFIRPSVASGRGNYVRFDVDKRTADALRIFSRQQKVSSFSVFITAIYYLLYRYSDQNDICLGMPVANREHPSLEKLVGFFVNTVVLRLRSEHLEASSAQDLIQYVHDIILQVQEHQNVPFEKILNFLNPQRSTGLSPVFQVLVNYATLGVSEWQWEGCVLKPSFDLESNGAKFDLTFTYNEFADGSANLFIEYATDLFMPGTIHQTGNYILQLINTMIETPESPVSGAFWKKSLSDNIENNGSATGSFPFDRCLHQLLEQQSKQTPDEIAVRYENESITYEELNRRSARLAVYLQSLKGTTDRPIGICLEHGPELVISMFGILKSGAPYLPMDASSPSGFKKYIIDDSRLDKLICDDTTFNDLSGMVGEHIQLVNIDALKNELIHISTNYTSVAVPDDLAYLMYTSGSAGMPKGVMITHRNVVNHNYSVMDVYGIRAGIKVLQFSSESFDIFVEEVFPTLLSGATLVMPDYQKRTDVGYLKKLIRIEHVAIANFPTAFWHTVAEEDFSGSSLTTVIIGGEKADSFLLQKWYQQNPGITIFNTYGPTETTVISLLHKTNANDDFTKEVPLGTPIANTQMYILDKNLNHVPDGVPGELYIGGWGVAKGYWNNPFLTEQQFVASPFVRNERIYKTGDKVRRTADGRLVFLGRLDQQVKIRGFRVDTETIEHMLLQCPGVKNAAVIAKAHEKDKQLIAFVVLKNKVAFEETDIQSFLKLNLPEYMVPKAIESVKEIPLTVNGKTDKTRLRALPVNVERSKEYVAPQTDWECKINSVWQQILSLKKIGVYDNFFEIGGHSLLSVQLINILKQRFRLELSIIEIMQQPTIFELAKLAEQKQAGIAAIHPDILLLRKAAAQTQDAPTFIIPGMPGLSDGYQELARNIKGSGAVYGLQMKGFRDHKPLETIAEMARHNWSLIQQIHPKGRLRLWAHSYGGTILYEMLSRWPHGNWEVEQVVLMDSGKFQDENLADQSSVLLFFRSLLSGFNIKEEGIYEEIVQIISNNPREEWRPLLDALFVRIKRSDVNNFFYSVWSVVAASLSATYNYSKGKLPYNVDFIIAEQSVSWLKADDWDDYYVSVASRVVPGDHLSMVREPDCSVWVKEV